jgi:hypothetical protein
MPTKVSATAWASVSEASWNHSLRRGAVMID